MVIKKSSDMPQGQRNGRSRLLNSIATRFSFVVVCLVISLLVSANTADARLQGGPPPGKFGMITCVPVIIDDEVYTIDDERIDVEDDWECDMLDDDEYGNSNLITFSKKSRDFLASHGISSYQHLVTFKGRIRRTNGKEVIDIRTNFGITVEDYNQDVRRLRQKEGAYTILVIRVTDKDGHAPLEDQLELSNSVFGGGDDLHSLATQMDACSGGRLIYSPVVDDPSANTTGGVVDLHISNSVLDYGPYTRYDSTDMDRKQLEKDVMSELVENFPVYENWRNNAHVMIVFPREANFREEGRSGEAIAYAYVGGKKSVYKDPYGSQLWVQVHEIGHNNGLGHSGSWYGSTKKTYGDATCMMGSHSRGGDDAPLLCYNGAKNWHMGWYQYENGHETVPYSGTWEGKLIAIPDYLDVGNPDGAYRTIVNIDDLYIQFNRPVGPTAGLLPEDSNKVTVTLQSSMNYGAQSYKLGESLGAGDSMEHGVHIVRVLEVNLDAQPPYARIGVSHKDSTFSPTAAPTTPTDPPSMSPTTLPSSSPTSTPTASPTVAASGTPTGIPTSSPTSTPTASPTVAASGTPTGIPTSSPTSTPTASPTVAASGTPTGIPTSSPTSTPTASPTVAASSTPTGVPTSSPTSSPTASPTVAASSTPTGVPTSSPTSSPTASPTVTASSTPTGVPTSSPTSSPTASPTVTASGAPTGVPTSSPTSAPSGSPTVTPSDLVIYEILPNPETENDKNAEYIKLFNPSAVESVVLSEYQVYDATSNRYSTLGNKVLGPRETFVLCRNKSWFDNADTSLRPVGAAEGCDLQGYFVLHDRLSTILLEKRDGSVDGVDFYEEIDSVQAVEAIKHGDEVYRRLSAETNVEPECATCFDWVSAYENDVVV